MTNPQGTVAVVGAGLSGLSVAEELRRAGHRGRLVLVGDERYPPYDRPPLSKEVLRGTRTPADVRLRDDAFFADHDIELRLGAPATALDTRRREVALHDGATFGYDAAVIATGVRARELPAVLQAGSTRVLRTLDDCLALRQSVMTNRSVLLIGAGFIGCEVAATLVEADHQVCVVEQLSAPLAGALGTEVGELVGRLHKAAGVDVRCGVGVAGLEDTADGVRARLTDGSTVEAAVVVAGLGAQPNVEWLRGSGVEVADGVRCDERGRTTAEGVWAAGDVAAWHVPGRGSRRVEHWTRARDHARVIAADIVGTDSPDLPVPYFWSDQYGLKIQLYGENTVTDDVTVLYDDGRRFVAVYSARGVVSAVAGAGMAGKLTRLCGLIGQPASAIDEVRV